MTQNEQVIDVLKTRPLTQMQANELGIGRLAARINELRDMGFNIQSDKVAVYKANGKIAHIAVYQMVQQ